MSYEYEKRIGMALASEDGVRKAHTGQDQS
jgi:hypothetical protein